MRVLFVSQRLPPEHVSGAPLQALRLARALADEDMEVTILTTRFAAAQPTGPFEIEGVRAYRLPTIPELRASYAALAASYVRHAKTDLIHGHALSATCLGAAFAARVPVLLKPSLGGASGDLEKIRRSPLAPLLLRTLEQVDRFAVVSREIQEELTAIGVPEAKLFAAKNGVDLERFRPDGPRAELGVDGPVVLFAGQLIARKGVDLLMQAWLQIAETRPDAWLVLAGPGDPPRGARVLALGVRDDIDAVMRRASVLVLPSSNEGLPNVSLEAIAVGLPVVTTLRLPHELGIEAVAASADAIAQAVLLALDRPRVSPPPAVNRYALANVAREYAALYRAMLSR